MRNQKNNEEDKKGLPFMVRMNLKTGKFHRSQIYKEKEIGQLKDGKIQVDPLEIEGIVPWCDMNLDQLSYIAICAEIGEFYCRVCARLHITPERIFHKFCAARKYTIPECEIRDELQEQINAKQ